MAIDAQQAILETTKCIPGNDDCCPMSLIASLREEPSLRRPGIVLAGLLATVLIGERLLTNAVTGVRQGPTAFPVWLPELGSIGETIVFYSMLFDFLKFVAIPAVLLWLACQFGRQRAQN